MWSTLQCALKYWILIYLVKKEAWCPFLLCSNISVVWWVKMSRHCLIIKKPWLSIGKDWRLIYREYSRDLAWLLPVCHSMISSERVIERRATFLKTQSKQTSRTNCEIFSLYIFLLIGLEFVVVLYVVLFVSVIASISSRCSKKGCLWQFWQNKKIYKNIYFSPGKIA